MSGSRFLVSLREVSNSEKMAKVGTVSQESINFWDDDISINDSINELIKELDREIDNITAKVLESKHVEKSQEAAIAIAGYRKFSECWKCCEFNGQLFAKKK